MFLRIAAWYHISWSFDLKKIMNSILYLNLSKWHLFGFFVVILLFLGNAHSAQAAVRTWDGGGADNLWSTCANWDGPDACPGAGDVATFNGTNTKASTIDEAYAGSVGGIDIDVGYSNTITNSRSSTLTVGASNFAQDAGTFNGGSGAITINGSISLGVGAAFTSTSGNLTVSLGWTNSGATFTHNDGTVTFTGNGTTIDVNTSQTFYDFTLNKNSGWQLTVAAGDTIVVAHTATLTQGRINKTDVNSIMEFQGDLSIASTYTSGADCKFNFANSTVDQNISGVGLASLTHPVTVNKASGSVIQGSTLTMTSAAFAISSGTYNSNGGAFTVNSGSSFTISGGAFNGSNSTMSMDGTFTISGGVFTSTSGTLTVSNTWTHTGGGTFTHNNGTVIFTGMNTNANIAADETFYNLQINKTAGWTLTVSSGYALLSTNLLTLTEGAVGTGELEAQGGVTVTSGFDGGSYASLTFSGGNTQTFTLTGAESLINKNVIINKSGGSVNLASTLTMDAGASNNLTVTAGTLYTNGQTLTMSGGGVLTVSNGGTLKLNGNETISTPTFNAGSTAEYAATSGTITIQSWTYQNLTINGSGSTFQLSAGKAVFGDFTLAAGTFNANNYEFEMKGNATISGGTFKTGTGSNIIFGDAAGDSVTMSGGELQIQMAATDTNIVKNAGSWTNSGGMITYNAAPVVSTKVLSTLSPYNNLKIDSVGSTYTLDGAIVISGNLSLSAGTLDVSGSSYGITIGGEWQNGGSFTQRAGTVTFNDNSKTSILTGNTTFQNVTCTTASKAITFTAGTTQTVNGLLTLTGADSQFITLRSSSDNSAWYLNVAGSSSVDYVNVRDSDASGGNAITHAVSPSRSVNVANNVNWSFNVAPTVASVSATQGADGRVTILFTIDDADADDTCQALVEYDVGSGFLKATISEADVDTSATYGDPEVTTAGTYQVGNASGYITTSSGANTVSTVWNAPADESEIDVSDAVIRITPYDGTEAGATDSSIGFSLDLTAPSVSSASYLDTDGDGTVDRVDVVFDEDVSVSYDASDWSFSEPGTVNLADTGASVSTDTAQVTVSASANLTGGITDPTVLYTNNANRLTDLFNNAIATFGAPLTVADAAAPVALAYAYRDADGDGTVDRADVTFTEDVAYDECEPGDYAFGGADAGTVAVASCATSSADLRLTISNAPANDTNLALTWAYDKDAGTTYSLDDASGNFVADISAQSLSDFAAPHLVSGAYQDADGDGTVDRVALIFTENTTIVYSDGDWTATPNDLTSFDVSAVSSGNGTSTVVLTATAAANLTGVSGGTEPTLAFAAAGGSISDGTNQLATISAASISDSAAPVILVVTPSDGAEGVATDASVSVTFSEAMDTVFAEGTEFAATPDATSWSAAWSLSDSVVTLSHSNDFNCNTTYSVALDAAEIASSNAETLLTTGPEDGTWWFAIRSCGGSGGGGGGSSTMTGTTPVVMLTNPDNGDSFAGGEDATVGWTTSGPGHDTISLAYSLDSGVTYVQVAYNLAKELGIYAWTLPNVNASDVILKIISYDTGKGTLDTDTVTFDISYSEEADAEAVAKEEGLGSTDGTETDSEGRNIAPGSGEYGSSPLDGSEEEISVVLAGQFVRAYGFPSIYYVDSGLGRRVFWDTNAFFTWADSWNNVVWVTDATLPTMAFGDAMLPKPGVVLVKVQSDPRVYVIGEDGAGNTILRWVPSEDIAAALFGSDWADYVIDVDATIFSKFGAGDDMGVIDYVDTRVMKTRAMLSDLAI